MQEVSGGSDWMVTNSGDLRETSLMKRLSFNWASKDEWEFDGQGEQRVVK